MLLPVSSLGFPAFFLSSLLPVLLFTIVDRGWIVDTAFTGGLSFRKLGQIGADPTGLLRHISHFASHISPFALAPVFLGSNTLLSLYFSSITVHRLLYSSDTCPSSLVATPPFHGISTHNTSVSSVFLLMARLLHHTDCHRFHNSSPLFVGAMLHHIHVRPYSAQEHRTSGMAGFFASLYVP